MLINLDQRQIFYFLSVALGVYLASISALIFYYLRSSNREGKSGYLFLKTTKEFEEYLEKLMEALMEAEIKNLILELNKKVQYLINEAVDSYKKEISHFSQILEKESLEMSAFNEKLQERILKEAEEKIKVLEEEVEKGISNFRKNQSQTQALLAQRTENEIERLSKDITEQINLIYQSTFEKMDKKILEAEEKIEEYKKERIKVLDQKIYQIIAEVAKKTIGKAIDISTHEELVMEALAKAKREKFF